jgi:hypothetical protein
LASIKSDIARARAEYAEEVMKREKHTHSVISQIICRLILGQFASYNDSLKKCGQIITKMKEWSPFAGQDMPSPLDLDCFLEMQNMTLPSENNDSNNDELISSKKPSRRSSYRISSILEMQKAAMNNNKSNPPLIEEPENNDVTKDSKSLTSTTSEKSSDHVLSISVETTTTTVITDISENAKNTAATEIGSLISSTNVPNSKEKESLINNKPLTPNLISNLSIGIHDNDNPFFRDGSSREIISPDIITETKEKTNLIIQKKETKLIETMNSDEKKNSTKLEESHIVSLTPPPAYNKLRDIIKNNGRRTSDQLKNEEEINSSNPVPIGNTFRISFVENNHETIENGVRNVTDKYNSNEYKEGEYQSMRSTSSFETDILVRSFPIDLPVRSLPQTPSNSPKQRPGLYYTRMDNSGGCNRDCDPIINDNDYRETFPYQHSDSLRYDDNGPINSFAISQDDNKRGPSVADIRERLLSLNAHERKPVIYLSSKLSCKQ